MQHLPRSLQPVALIAVRETGAGGCAISEVDADGAARVVAAFVVAQELIWSTVPLPDTTALPPVEK